MGKGAPRAMPAGFSRLTSYVTAAGVGPTLVRSVAGSGAVRIAGMVASFAVGIQLARLLGVEGYGHYGVALAVITIAGIPSQFGLPILVTREVAAADAKRDYGKLFGVLRWADKACIWIAAAVALAVLAAGAVVYALGHRALGGALLLGAPAIPLTALGKIRGGALMGLHHVARGQVPDGIVRPLVLSLLLLGFFLLHEPLEAPVAMALNSAAALAMLVVSEVWLRRRLPASSAPKRVITGRQWLRSSVPMGLMEGMRMLQTELCYVLVGLLVSAVIVGLLRIASVTAMTAAAPAVIVSLAAMPVMARLHAEGDRERLQKTVSAVAQAQFAGVLLLSLPLFLFPGPLLSLAFGSEFAAADNALRLLCIGQVASAAFGPNIWLLNMTHHEQRVTRALAIALALTIVLIAPLVLRWGVEGAAVALIAGMFCWNVITWRDAQKRLGIETSIARWPWRTKAEA
jgi:O-antigen/teichoic acid export membrane protein